MKLLMVNAKLASMYAVIVRCLDGYEHEKKFKKKTWYRCIASILVDMVIRAL